MNNNKRMNSSILTLAMLLFSLAFQANASNPIKKDFGMADPHCYIFNGKAYIIFGHHVSTKRDRNYYIAQLNEDMVSLAEKPKEVIINNLENYLRGNNKLNLHKRNCIYHLSAGSDYATSKNVYGPYEVVGNSGNRLNGLTGRAHGNYFTWHNQWFHTWCHFYLGKDAARYRESYVGYLHYKDNEEMVDDVDFLKKHFATGVGKYDAIWEWEICFYS